MGGQSLCSFQTSRCSRQAQWNTAVPRLSRCFCIRSSGRVGPTDALAHVCLWMGQRPTLRQNSLHSTATLLPEVHFLEQALAGADFSKIRTFTREEARCRVRLRSNFRHVAAAFLSHTGRFVIESICQENNIISNQ